MRELIFLALWSAICAGGAGLLWKMSGSRNKIYGLFIINMLYLAVVFLGYPIW